MKRPLVWSAASLCLGAYSAQGAIPWSFFWVLWALGVGLCSRRSVLAVPCLPALWFVLGAQLVPRVPTDSAEAVLGPPPWPKAVVEGFVEEREDQRARIRIVGISRGPVPARIEPAWGEAWLRFAKPPCGKVGDRIRVWAQLKRPQPRRFQGGFSARAWAHSQGFSLLGFVPGGGCVVLIESEVSAWDAAFRGLRERVHRAIDKAMAPSRAGVVRALATGDRTGMDRVLQENFRNAGLAHLTAVSGFHLGVLAWTMYSLCLTCFRRLPRIAEGFGARPAAALCTLPGVLLYPCFVGLPPSAVRAAAMLSVLLLAQLARKRPELWSALGAAFIGMVIIDPNMLRDPGFQLSFGAVVALLRLGPAFERWLPDRCRAWPGFVWLWSPFSASMAATLGTLPIVAYHFGQVSVVGLVANVPAGLIAVVAVPLSLVGGFLAVWLPSVGDLVLSTAGWMVEILSRLASFSASSRWSVWTLPEPTWWQFSCYWIAMFGFSSAESRRWLRLASWGSFLLWCLALTVTASAPWFRCSMRMTFLPVGQGDSVVVELPGGKVMVVDAGPKGAGHSVLVPFLRARQLRKIDLFVATHPHADHIGGLSELSEKVPIKTMWYNGDTREGPKAELDVLARNGTVPSQGEERVFSGFCGEPVKVRVLGPARSAHHYREVNDASVVLMLQQYRRKALLTGDAEREGETELVGLDVRAELLKAGHHGSRSSSQEDFLEAVHPRYVVISLGKGNRFRFPHREAMQRIQKTEASVFRTDQQGAITVEFAKESLLIRPYL